MRYHSSECLAIQCRDECCAEEYHKMSHLLVQGVGFALIEIMVVVAITASLAAVAIPNLRKAKIIANESAAQATLKCISTAAETFATSNSGLYPGSETSLVTASPPYYDRAYCNQSFQGYSYSCSFTFGGYTIVATPVSSYTGTHIYTITTGAILTGQ